MGAMDSSPGDSAFHRYRVLRHRLVRRCEGDAVSESGLARNGDQAPPLATCHSLSLGCSLARAPLAKYLDTGQGPFRLVEAGLLYKSAVVVPPSFV